MKWRVAAASHIGGRPEQQDRTLVLHDSASRAHLIVLSDGMGGHAHGAQAAQALIDVARRAFPPFSMQSPQQFLLSVCHNAHRSIRSLRGQGGSVAPPGATCVLLYLRDAEAHWLHVGDSRLYHFQAERLISCTEDHTLGNLQSPGSAAGGPLYDYLGGEDKPEPTTAASAVGKQDWFLLCSDGFWHSVSAVEACRAVVAEPLQQIAENLTELAVQRAGKGGDNVSLVLARAHRRRYFPGLLRRLFSRR